MTLEQTRRAAWVTPLSREDLFDPGTVFPREELTRRIISFFWRDCCCPACFSRAPAPVLELAAAWAFSAPPAQPLHAWWLLEDGIIEDTEGPEADLLAAYLGPSGSAGQTWPRYAFRLTPEPLEVEMFFFRERHATQGQRIRFAPAGAGRICVIGQELSWNL